MDRTETIRGGEKAREIELDGDGGHFQEQIQRNSLLRAHSLTTSLAPHYYSSLQAH